jgi:hypothetical protein
MSTKNKGFSGKSGKGLHGRKVADFMIVMPADNSGIRVGYLAGRFPGRVGQLFSPRPGRVPCGPFEFCPYALDNGRFSAGDTWNEADWFRMLDWAKLSGFPPRFALVPDVVGDRDGTLASWEQWRGPLSLYGWPLGFAVQDGMTPADVPCGAAVVFVGGTTEWKWRSLPIWCARFPRVHVGRVNSWRKLWIAHDLGAESVDGTGWTRGNVLDSRKYPALLDYLDKSENGTRHLQGQLVL